MAIVSSVCSSFLQELMNKEHDLNTDSIKMALYTIGATLGAATTAYSATNEVTGTGYTAGGVTLTNGVLSLSGGVAFVDWDNAVWTSSTITANGGLIYNSSNSNKAIASIYFGGDFVTSNQALTYAFPTADSANAIIRIGPG